MNWDAIGAVGEIVGAAAVVVSLIYLAAQIRVGSRELRTNIRDSAFHSLMEWNHHIMSDPSLSRLFQMGCRDIEPLTVEERMQFGHILYSFFKMFENIYLHYLDGSIEEDVWIYNKAMLLTYANQPGARHYLDEREKIYDPRFWKYLDEHRTVEVRAWSAIASPVPETGKADEVDSDA